MKKLPSLLLCAAALVPSASAEGLSDVVSHLAETHWYTYACVILLVLFAAGLIKAGKSTKWNSRMLAYAALCVAISYILSCIRLYRFSFGGSITLLSMLPLIMFAYANGTLPGVLVGCAYGLLQLIQDFYFAHPVQIFMDYPLAFAAIGLAGLASKLPVNDKLKLPMAVITGCLARYIIHVISGAVFFGEYASPGQTALTYSLVYNLGYMGPDTALCLIAAFMPFSSRLVRQMRANKK